MKKMVIIFGGKLIRKFQGICDNAASVLELIKEGGSTKDPSGIFTEPRISTIKPTSK